MSPESSSTSPSGNIWKWIPDVISFHHSLWFVHSKWTTKFTYQCPGNIPESEESLAIAHYCLSFWSQNMSNAVLFVPSLPHICTFPPERVNPMREKVLLCFPMHDYTPKAQKFPKWMNSCMRKGRVEEFTPLPLEVGSLDYSLVAIWKLGESAESQAHPRSPAPESVYKPDSLVSL